MGSPLSLALANIVIYSFESRWLRICPNEVLKFSIISSVEILTEEILNGKLHFLCSGILYKNSGLCDFIDKYIIEFLNKILATETIVNAESKKDLVIDLQCLGKLSLQIRTRINCIIKNKFPYCNLRFVF